MGRVTNSILSGTSGRTGRIVIANVHGMEISRHRPAKRNTATAQQMAHQELFRFAVSFLGLYKSFSRLFFGKRAGLITSYNRAQANALDSIQHVNGEMVINYPNVCISKGNLLEMIPASLSAETAQRITITWANNAPDDSNKHDLLTVFVYSPLRKDGQLFTGVAERQNATVTVSMLSHYAGEQVHVWSAFTNAEATMACNSKYLGTVWLT